MPNFVRCNQGYFVINHKYYLLGFILIVENKQKRCCIILSYCFFWQSALGAEGISLEFRHIATYLIWYCSHFVSCEDLLHEIILIVGYFTILNTDNQVGISAVKLQTLLNYDLEIKCASLMPCQTFWETAGSRVHCINMIRKQNHTLL